VLEKDLSGLRLNSRCLFWMKVEDTIVNVDFFEHIGILCCHAIRVSTQSIFFK
jgi:hypothetical protein